MKTIMFTMGSRGDVQPYIFLAQALQDKGVEASIGTHPCWKELVLDAGVGFVPIGPDVNMEYESAVIRGKTKNPMMSLLKTMNFIFKIIENSSEDIYNACEEMDFVIVSHSHMGAVEAEVRGLKTIDVTLQSETIPQVGKPTNLFGKMIGSLITAQMVKPYNKIGKKYGMPKRKSMDGFVSKDLNLIPISSYILERSPYWEKKNQIVGYWYRESPDYQPDESVQAFLEAGEKPVIVALGAMSFENNEEKDKMDAFVHAFEKTGKRAMIQGFHQTLQNYKLPDTMIAIGSIPHSWLFRQGWCVIHHSGFGTASAALIFGIPSIPVPHALDQFGVADMLYKKGVACKPVRSSELSEERLIDAIHEMEQNYTNISEKTVELSRKMQEEKGLDQAVNLIFQVVNS